MEHHMAPRGNNRIRELISNLSFSVFIDSLKRFLNTGTNIIWFSLVVSVFCFFPSFVSGVDYHLLFPISEDLFETYQDSFYVLSKSTVGIVIIPTAIDAFIDLFPWLGAYLSSTTGKKGDKTRQSKDETSVGQLHNEQQEIVMTRLTAFERIVFCIGVAIEPLIVNLDINNGDYFHCLYLGAQYFKLAVTFVPIISFLQRCTTTWTPRWTSSMTVILCMGIVFLIISWSTVPGTRVNFALMSLGGYLLYLAAALYFFVCGKCLYGYWRMRRRRAQVTNGNEDDDESEESHDAADEKGEEMEAKIRRIDEFYANYVPAAHMISTVLLIIAVAIPSVTVNYSALIISNFLMLVFVVIIIVTEKRVCSNEVERAMLRMVQSIKKSYVRYLSHELRTPLNTTFLGTQLLKDELANRGDPDDEENLEILSGMNAACKTAVGILDDMINFDKLESGILTMRKTDVHVLPFLRDCASILAAEAKSCGVAINVLVDGAPEPIARLRAVGNKGYLTGPKKAEPPSRPLQVGDMALLDKTKIEHVVCCLVSNILKTSKQGGNVHIHAAIIPRPQSTETKSPRKLSLFSSSSPRTFQKNIKVKRSMSEDTPKLSPGFFQFARSFQFPSNAKVDPAANNSSSEGSCQKSPSKSQGLLVITIGDIEDLLNDSGKNNENETTGSYEDTFRCKDIDRFDPSRLVAGGSDVMSMWIAKGIVELHGGVMKAFTRNPAGDSVKDENVDMGGIYMIELPIFLSRLERPAGGDSAADADAGSSRMQFKRPSGARAAANRRGNRVDAGGGGIGGGDDRDELHQSAKGLLDPQDRGRLELQLPSLANENVDADALLRQPTATRYEGTLHTTPHTPHTPYAILAAFASGSEERRRGIVGCDSATTGILDVYMPSFSNRANFRVKNTTAPGIAGGGAASAGGGASAGARRRPRMVASVDSSMPISVVSLFAETAERRASLRISTSQLQMASDIEAKKKKVAFCMQRMQSIRETDPGSATGALAENEETDLKSASKVPQKKLILVVDDSNLTRKMLCRTMVAAGFDTEEAADGQTAVDKVKAALLQQFYDHQEGRECRPYHCILMDFVMPVMDGPTATKEIRKLGFTAPIFGVTGNGQESDIEHFVSCGVNRVFTKPLDMAAFRQLLDDYTRSNSS